MPVFGQQIETMYPNGSIAISEEPLPVKVYLAQKNTIKAVWFL